MLRQLDHPPRNKRYTIGILSETAYHKTESLVFQGAQKAAELYDANLFLIMPLVDKRASTHYGQNDAQLNEQIRRGHDRLKEYLETFELDALIYIGWSQDFQGENGRYLCDILHPIRLMSISGSYPDIPCIVMPGEPYIKDLTSHLIKEHSKQRIAYIHPWKIVAY
jgi:DNA-binding LacI/PurR family transcriptional regulator